MDLIQIFRLNKPQEENFGVILVNYQFCCYSLELPWKSNIKNLSCIPPGQYYFEKYESPKFKFQCIKLFDVPEREFVSVHYGNKLKNTKGCILTGDDIVGNEIRWSKNALALLTKRLTEGNGILEIK